jgi:hypothetical protein
VKIVCEQAAVAIEVKSVALYRPVENEWCLAYARLYPWFFECPVCFCKDTIIEGCSQCNTCRLKVKWIDVMERDRNGRDLWQENLAILKTLSGSGWSGYSGI